MPSTERTHADRIRTLLDQFGEGLTHAQACNHLKEDGDPEPSAAVFSTVRKGWLEKKGITPKGYATDGGDTAEPKYKPERRAYEDEDGLPRKPRPCPPVRDEPPPTSPKTAAKYKNFKKLGGDKPALPAVRDPQPPPAVTEAPPDGNGKSALHGIVFAVAVQGVGGVEAARELLDKMESVRDALTE